MFSSCERANGFFTLRIHMRGKVAKKIYEQVCPTPLPKPPNARNRQTSVSSHRTHATLPRIQPAFRNTGAIQIRMYQMREKPVHQLHASLPPSANLVIVAAYWCCGRPRSEGKFGTALLRLRGESAGTPKKCAHADFVLDARGAEKEASNSDTLRGREARRAPRAGSTRVAPNSETTTPP
jgi:hypothetical protein